MPSLSSAGIGLADSAGVATRLQAVMMNVGAVVELSEACAYAALIANAEPEVIERYALQVQRIGSARAFVAAKKTDSLLLNRVVALGAEEDVTAGIVEEICALYADNGVHTFAIELAPLRNPEHSTALLLARGFVPFKRTSMLNRAVRPLPTASSELVIRRAGPPDADAFVTIASSIFGFGEPVPSLLASTFTHASWQHWIACDDDTPVATALTHVEGNTAWIGWVATQATHRGRGAQSALAAAQLEAAAAGGCDAATLEAAPGTRIRPSQTLRNYLRLGWTPVHDRIVYLYRDTQRDRRQAR
jgi:GNAT superfamily N-acetyltransferase